MIVKVAKYDMHDNATRRKVFWLLRRLTNYELWRRKRERFAHFTVQYEAAVKTPPREETDRVPADNLPIIYEILGLYDKGLRELAQGHRHVWRSGEPFDAAIDRYSHLCQYFYTDPEYWERGAQIKAYPPKVSALARLMHMSEFHGDYAPCEVVDSSGDVANLQSAAFLLAPENYRHQFYELEYPVFPASLPEPPDPPDVVIRSGQTVPFDGIWEPVTSTQTKLLGIVPVSLYTKGVEELGNGHRFVWRTGEALEAALDTSGTVHNFLYTHPGYWERGAQTAPYPDKVEALNRLLLASTYEGEYAPIEVPFGPQKSARYSSPGALLDPERYTYRFYQLAYPVFPAEIPEVPGGTDIIIRSGQRVPVDGIWEPVSIEREKALGVLPLDIRSIENNGCFNYLVSDTKAPNIMGQWSEVDSRTMRTTTHWRLLWEDTRYNDGVIPDESEYFLEPMHIDSATATQSDLPQGPSLRLS